MEQDLDAEANVVRVPMAQNLEPPVFTSLTGLRAGDEVTVSYLGGCYNTRRARQLRPGAAIGSTASAFVRLRRVFAHGLVLRQGLFCL